MNDVLLVAIVALVTMALRFLPFLIFGGHRQTPAFIAYLGRVLPFAIMGMLVVYCLRDMSVASAPYGLPEWLGVAALYLWKRNTLLSIGLGTAWYMLLVQLVF